MEQFSLEEYLAHPEKKVVTRDGRPARVICTDAKADDGACIIALIPGYGGEAAYQFFPDGRAFSSKSSVEDCADLFFADEEPELTEFEKAVDAIYESCDVKELALKKKAKELLGIAKKQLIPEFAATHYEEVMKAREEGKAEVMKDLPRWNRSIYKYNSSKCILVNNGPMDNPGDLQLYSPLAKRVIRVSDLEKLPGFKEDEK